MYNKTVYVLSLLTALSSSSLSLPTETKEKKNRHNRDSYIFSRQFRENKLKDFRNCTDFLKEKTSLKAK